MYGEKDAQGRTCKQRFKRPEHSRRHVLTVHSTARPHACKVPHCGGAFSRRDNLRDHYFTHVEKGGREGKNHKISLEELKEILGQKERKLVARLGVRLAKEKGRKGRARRARFVERGLA